MPRLLKPFLKKSPVQPLVYIGASLEDVEAAILGEALVWGDTLAVVCDHDTYAALGARVVEALDGVKRTVIILPDGILADDQAVAFIRTESAGCEALLAIGSGTINDLCKYASFLDKKSYAVCVTALSMNGYASANASIIVDGYKRSYPAHLPEAVLIDLEIAAQAPLELTRAGLGDSLCRSTAQADWLLSHLLLDTAYDPKLFEMIKPYEADLFMQSAGLLKGDLKVLAQLAKTLVLSGVGMTMAGGSYPASQGEHLIAHTMEMKHGSDLPHSYHGGQIGITTLTMAALQEHILASPAPPRLEIGENRQQDITDYFGEASAEKIQKEYQEKYNSIENIKDINNRLDRQLPQIRNAIEAIIQPAAALHGVLAAVGAPTEPEAIGWPDVDYRQAIRHAKYIRNRFTFLDLA